jgi:hypothetical protein
VAERLMFKSFVFLSKSLFKLRFVGFLGALVSYSVCMALPFNAYCYAYRLALSI